MYCIGRITEATKTVHITEQHTSLQNIKELVISLYSGTKYFYLPITLSIYVWQLILINIYNYITEVFVQLVTFRLVKYCEKSDESELYIEFFIPSMSFVADCYDCKYLPFNFFTDMYCYYWDNDYYELQYYQFVVVFGPEYIYNFKSVNYMFLRFWVPTFSFYFHYLKSYKTLFYSFSIWYKNFKTTILSIVFAIICLNILIDFFQINIIRQIGLWLIVGLLFFWLISGFNFFLKRYRFGKFTSAILRFWKRTNAVFWIIEGFLFSLFFYYYINSSQEPLYTYDTSSLNYDFLNSLPNAYWSYVLLVLLIWYSYYVLLQLPQGAIKQHMLTLSIITLGIIYIFLLESYQFYYVIGIFYENVWNFDFETNMWSLEIETPRIRVKQQYLILALIAKYWHFIFIFLSWLFFIFKSYEQKHISYIQLGWSIQNLLILFILNIVFIIQWFKWLIRRYYDIVYYWFFTDTNMFSFKLFVDEIINILFSNF